MDQRQFDDFLKKVAEHTHSPEELSAFLTWLQELPEEEAAAALDKYEQAFNSEEVVGNEVLQRIEEGIEHRLGAHPVHAIPPKRAPVFMVLKIAAIFVAAALLVTFFFYRSNFKNNEPAPGHTSLAIVPGKNQAVLKLEGGKSIPLEEVANGVITVDDMATGFEKKNGLLIAKRDEKAVNDAGEINILETPKGGQYQVALPDGSHVWLNASTRLYFPTVFKPGERKVRLLGEAYFEVKSDAKHPFIIETSKGAAIRVLGTGFNVSAYQNDTRETTTLIHGSVQITKGQSQVLLKPGQQAVVNAHEIANVSDVETSYAVAWKEGYFMFNREPINEVMDKIARWYDVDVVYQGQVPETKFWGTISRFSQVSDVLNMLQATGRVHFNIEGRKIYVKK